MFNFFATSLAVTLPFFVVVFFSLVTVPVFDLVRDALIFIAVSSTGKLMVLDFFAEALTLEPAFFTAGFLGAFFTAGIFGTVLEEVALLAEFFGVVLVLLGLGM